MALQTVLFHEMLYSFGENDRRTQQWQIKLNNAQATLNDLEKELKDNNDTLDKTADELKSDGE